jgi:hypothetical protein
MTSKERYFAVLTLLVGKLEAAEKTLREMLVEMMAEAAATSWRDERPLTRPWCPGSR